jgi:hypothetical protein
MKNDCEHFKDLDEIINTLNDKLGIMGNNLIEKQFELDYLKEVNQKLNIVIEQLNRINKKLMDQLNKKSYLKMNY